MECNCNLHHKLVGDGCHVCNPAMALETAYETITDLRAEIDRLRLDVWNQFSLDMDDGWQSDGALSTLESIADALLDSGVFERHPERPWYRIRQPNP